MSAELLNAIRQRGLIIGRRAGKRYWSKGVLREAQAGPGLSAREHEQGAKMPTQSPARPEFRALIPFWAVFTSYVLSFIYVGIYWNKLRYGCHPSTAASDTNRSAA
jgi:hypothetical protein